MLAEIDELLSRFQSGELSRRSALAAIAALTVPRWSPSQAGTPLVGHATYLNHATLRVKDVERSREFYQKLFGMPILTRQGVGVNLRAGAGFIGLYPAGGKEPPHIDHICITIDGFDARTVMAKLKPLNVHPEISQRGDTEELYIDDPDGLTIQIQDTKYRGGVGRLGDRDPG